ncbi:MAG TPA: hypothetical protein VEB20_07350 [Azospirillaceae bacterium]|nr:hypothetical protein [Azospirillaceae bacterium]
MTLASLVAGASAAPAAGACDAAVSGTRSTLQQQGIPGLSAVAQDTAFCARVALQPGSGGQAARGIRLSGGVAALLRRAGIALDPQHAVSTALHHPPEVWPPGQGPAVLSVLLALPLAQRPDRVLSVAQEMRSPAGAQAWSLFADPASRGTTLQGRQYAVRVSYGCILLQEDAFTVKAVLPVARSHRCGG